MEEKTSSSTPRDAEHCEAPVTYGDLGALRGELLDRLCEFIENDDLVEVLQWDSPLLVAMHRFEEAATRFGEQRARKAIEREQVEAVKSSPESPPHPSPPGWAGNKCSCGLPGGEATYVAKKMAAGSNWVIQHRNGRFLSGFHGLVAGPDNAWRFDEGTAHAIAHTLSVVDPVCGGALGTDDE